ncbi:hypothetical protein JYK04_01315 [Streptomyces nojiriensis]|nr:hypothetical protein JYK04_01315 [Streptomyces nojiriensis]
MPEQGRETEADAGSAAQQGASQWAGLTAASDAGMDRFARLVSRLLHAPVAFVSLVEQNRQILPGLIGLLEPWAEPRAAAVSFALPVRGGLRAAAGGAGRPRRRAAPHPSGRHGPRGHRVRGNASDRHRRARRGLSVCDRPLSAGLGARRAVRPGGSGRGMLRRAASARPVGEEPVRAAGAGDRAGRRRACQKRCAASGTTSPGWIGPRRAAAEGLGGARPDVGVGGRSATSAGPVRRRREALVRWSAGR